ncbi:hypothetical protein ACVWXL_006133 [Bradyrhizobium sp. GM22.5]
MVSKIVRDLALMHHDVRVDRLAQMIVGRDDGAVRQMQRTLA